MFYSIRQIWDRDQDRQNRKDAELEAAREADSFSFGPKQKLTNTRGSVLDMQAALEKATGRKIPQRVICPYCGAAAKLVDSATVYHGKSYGMIWDCRPCDAYVGTHKNSGNIPLGRLANAELRTWKVKAHAAFDPLWKSGRMSRGRAYSLMQRLMDMPKQHAHIGLFDVDDCKRLIEKLNLVSAD